MHKPYNKKFGSSGAFPTSEHLQNANVTLHVREFVDDDEACYVTLRGMQRVYGRSLLDPSIWLFVWIVPCASRGLCVQSSGEQAPGASHCGR